MTNTMMKQQKQQKHHKQQQQLYVLDDRYTYKTVTEAVKEYGVNIPAEFICPITLEVMIHPIMSRYGHNYEKDAILQWVGKNGQCPLTRQSIRLRDLLPNKTLENKIAMWLWENSLPQPIISSSTTTRNNNNDQSMLVIISTN